jgi:hypothetical protein
MSRGINNVNKSDETKQLDLAYLILKALGKIENGSLTIIKQDDNIIQVNSNEKYLLNR